MTTFLITLSILLFINFLLFSFSVNAPEKKTKKADLKKVKQPIIIINENIVVSDIQKPLETVSSEFDFSSKQQKLYKKTIEKTTKQHEPVLVSE